MSFTDRIKSVFTGSTDERSDKALIIGIDCGAPKILFEDMYDELENLNELMEDGTYARLRSVTPPITNPAWYCMMASKRPGTLGAYGFRHRTVGSYEDKYLATHDRIDHDRLWNILSDRDRTMHVIGVPNTFPPDEIDGTMITSFLTPDTDSQFVHPPTKKQEIIDIASFAGEYSEPDTGYMLDIEDFRTDDKDRILDHIFQMTEKKTRVTKHVMQDDWDALMTVYMAPDRLHHGFWKYYDEEHKDYEEGNEYEDAIPDYYRFLDDQLGELLDEIDDDTTVFVVSDHGARAIDGCICLNEFLREEGYLELNEEPDEMQRLDESMIDWDNTEAWGWGGYYARLFLNVEGREDNGQVPEDEYEAKRDELIEKLENLEGPDGEDIGTKVMKPENVYDEVNGDQPDLMVFFGNLDWRSSGSVGTDSLYLEENDTGPDHANHDWHGIMIAHRPDKEGRGKISDQSMLDIAPTVMRTLGERPPEDFEGDEIQLWRDDQ